MTVNHSAMQTSTRCALTCCSSLASGLVPSAKHVAAQHRVDADADSKHHETSDGFRGHLVCLRTPLHGLDYPLSHTVIGTDLPDIALGPANGIALLSQITGNVCADAF